MNVQNVVLGLCAAPETIFGQEAVRKVVSAFLAGLPTASRPLPADGLSCTLLCLHFGHHAGDVRVAPRCKPE